MRTTLNIDAEALEAALRAAEGERTRTDVINEALREYARRRRLRGLLEVEGKIRWVGNLDQLRKRMPRRRTEQKARAASR